MPRHASNRPGRPRRNAVEADGEPLIDWHEPERNAHVLDWRERAQEFGLSTGEDTAESVVLPPEQLIEEDDPEAFDRQTPDAEEAEDEDDEERSPEDIEEAAAPGVSREDLDLVRVYLKHVGRRKLLKAREEQEIGQRIETARAELQATLGTIPCAVRTLLSLAEEVRRGTTPAAELILLPDGGELKKENVAPVLAAFNRVKAAQRRIEEWRQRCEDRRSTQTSRAGYRKAIDDGHREISAVLRTLPLRPSLIDEVIAELRELDGQFNEVENLPRASRTSELLSVCSVEGRPRNANGERNRCRSVFQDPS